MTDDRLFDLLAAYLEDRLNPAEAAELQAELRTSARARAQYWELVEQHALIEDVLREARGADLAAVESRAWPGDVDRAPELSRGRRFIGRALVLAAAVLLPVVAFWWIASTPDGALDALTVRVVEVGGQADLMLAAGVHAIQRGERITPGRTIRTGDDQSFLVLEYPDHTRLELGAATTLTLSANEEGPARKRVALEAGSMVAEVAPQPAGQPMVVASARGELRVTDTRLLLASASPERSRLDLARGQGLVFGADGVGVRIDAGQSAFVSAAEAVEVRALPAGPTQPRSEVSLKGLQSVRFAPDGRTILAATSHQAVFWDGAGGLETVPLFKDQWSGWIGLWAPGGDVLAIGNHKTRQMLLWNPSDRRFGQTIAMPDGVPRDGLVVAPQARWLAAPDLREGSTRIRIWNGATGEEVEFPGLAHRIGAMAFSPDGETLAVGRGDMGESDKNELLLFEPGTGVQRGALPTRVKVVGGMTYSADGKLLAGGARGKLHLWDVAARKLVRTITGHERHLLTLAFSPDGRLLAGATHQGPVWIWNVADGSEHAILNVQAHGARSLAFAPDGRSLALIGPDGRSLQLWDVLELPQP